MSCRCGERRAAIGQGLRAAVRGDLAGACAAAAQVGRTTVQDVEAMAAAMARRRDRSLPRQPEVTQDGNTVARRAQWVLPGG